MAVDPLGWIDDEAAGWSERGLARSLRPTAGGLASLVDRDGRQLVNFASNDYLGLAADPRVVRAATEAADRLGWGASASPLVSGWTDEHEALAAELAAFEGVEAVALFPTGYAANLGALASLVGRPDAIYSDRLNHACLIDGARLSGATIRIYPHADPESLAVLLAGDEGRFRRSLIATDGVFSMDGGLAPLGLIAELATRFGAILLVDEAHGTGVFGPTGRGAAEELGVAGRVDVRVGTLSKALGSVGGFVAGSRRLVDWLINHARTLIFSTASPAPAAAAARAALGLAQGEPWRRERARSLGKWIASELGVPSPGGPIIPVHVGEPGLALSMAVHLADRGFLVPAIRPPTVPEGTSRLRVCLSAGHTDAQVEGLILAFRSARA